MQITFLYCDDTLEGIYCLVEKATLNFKHTFQIIVLFQKQYKPAIYSIN